MTCSCQAHCWATSVIKQSKRPIFKSCHATTPYGAVPARQLLKTRENRKGTIVRKLMVCDRTMRERIHDPRWPRSTLPVSGRNSVVGPECRPMSPLWSRTKLTPPSLGCQLSRILPYSSGEASLSPKFDLDCIQLQMIRPPPWNIGSRGAFAHAEARLAHILVVSWRILSVPNSLLSVLSPWTGQNTPASWNHFMSGGA